MPNTLAQSLPWPNANNSADETTAETTSGTKEATPWVKVAVNLNPAEATVIKSRLESEGIIAIIQQEALGSVLGLSVGPLGSAKVLVPEPQADQALDILSETFEADEANELWDNDEFEGEDH